MTIAPVGAPTGNPVRQPDSPAKIHDAAMQFEALLLGQILRAARESGGGWMGSSDGASDCAMEFAEQQLSMVMAQSGGLGLASLIASGLESR